MRSTLITLSALSLFFTTYALPLEQENDEEQRVFGNSYSNLELSLVSRFAVNADDRVDLLDIVENNRLDVWQLTPDHIDIHTAVSGRSGHPTELFPGWNNVRNSVFPARMHALGFYSGEGAVSVEDEPASSFPPLANSTFHNSYHPLAEVDTFLTQLATAPSRYANANLLWLGHSAEGREMLGVKLSSPDSTLKKKDKKAIIIAGAQHAREWIASASALYIAHALVSDPSTQHSLNHLLDEFDFHIIPIPNPDGYLYTWAPDGDRFWYKNRMIVSPSEKCQGVDMNRNWGYEWSPFASLSSSKPNLNTDPCSPLFPGHRPFEAPEVNNVANYVTQQVGTAASVFLELRSYGQMVSVPFSHSCSVMPADAEDLLEAALGMAQSAKKKHGTAYTTGNLCSNLYAAPGNVLDWMYSAAGVPFTYSVHLADTGTYGYALPASWIRPVGEEIGTMLQYLAGFVMKRGSKGL